jgi:hypothetical protein
MKRVKVGNLYIDCTGHTVWIFAFLFYFCSCVWDGYRCTLLFYAECRIGFMDCLYLNTPIWRIPGDFLSQPRNAGEHRLGTTGTSVIFLIIKTKMDQIASPIDRTGMNDNFLTPIKSWTTV